MGAALLCDGCSKDISLENKVALSVGALDGSSVQLDFCWDCAKPIRRIDAVKEQMRAKRQEIQQRQEEIRLSLSEPMAKPDYPNDNADVDPDSEVVH